MTKVVSLLSVALTVFALPLFSYAQDATQEAAPPLPEDVIAMFDYDQNAPLEIEEVATEMRGDVTVKDITYASPVDGEPISAYLVVPPGDGPFPAVLYVHWYERENPTSNRTQFVDEAVMLAQENGVMSLLPNTMWSDWSWYLEGRTIDSDYQDAINQVIELRRALDVLLSQPGVDPERVAFVGHDFGAMYGSLMGAVDRRPTAYVMIAGASNFNQWMLFGVDETQPGVDQYKAHMEELAPTRFIGQVAPAPVLFQFGTEDFYTPQEDYEAFFDAAAEPKEIQTYASEHAMTLDEIQADRLTFLREQLGLN